MDKPLETPNEGGRWERNPKTGKLTRTESAYTDKDVDPSTGKPIPGTAAERKALESRAKRQEAVTAPPTPPPPPALPSPPGSGMVESGQDSDESQAE